jgi:hypothetical protein
MATFSEQIVDLVGTFGDGTALNTFITEGANEVINAMPRPILERVADEVDVTDGTTSSETHKILYVLLDDQPCRLVPAFKRGRIQDSADMEFANASDPAYYIQDGKINVFPNSGTAKMVGVPVYNQGSPLNASTSTIPNFPDEYEYLVTLYAAIKALNQILNNLHSNTSITTAIGLMKTQIDDAVTEIGETIINVDSDLDSALTAMKTAAEKINTATPGALVLDDLNITAVAPLSPDLSDNSISFTTSAPTYVTSAYDSVALNNEDIELAQTQISKRQSDIQNQLNVFNEKNVEYQAELQRSIENARLSSQDDAQSLQKYSAEISEYSSNINKQVSEYQQNLAQKLQEFQSSIELTRVALSEVQAFGNEVSQRLAFVGAQGNVAASLIAAANAYANEIQTRLNIDSTEYTWYERQQAKLQADYDKGIQLLRGQ